MCHADHGSCRRPELYPSIWPPFLHHSIRGVRVVLSTPFQLLYPERQTRSAHKQTNSVRSLLDSDPGDENLYTFYV